MVGIQVLPESLRLGLVPDPKHRPHRLRLPLLPTVSAMPPQALLRMQHLDAAHLLVARIGPQVAAAVLAAISALVRLLLVDCPVRLLEQQLVMLGLALRLVDACDALAGHRCFESLFHVCRKLARLDMLTLVV